MQFDMHCSYLRTPMAATASSRAWLPLSEMEEFNNVTYETIRSYKDIPKLKRLERYMREEGFFQTAEIARQAIVDQGTGDMVDLEPRDSEVDDLRRGIHAWQASINGKDFELRRLQQSMTVNGVNEEQSEIRKRISAIPKPRKKMHETFEAVSEDVRLQLEKPKRSQLNHDIRSGREYYKKWDKFLSTWEKEEAEGQEAVEEEKNKKNSDLPPSKLDHVSTERRMLEVVKSKPAIEREWFAHREREKGNDLFKAKEYNASLHAYDQAIEMYCDCAATYANRAAVLLKMRRWDEAYSDCCKALELDPTYVKAFMRRGVACLERGDPAKALKDFETVFALDPSNEEIITLKKNAKKALEQQHSLSEHIGCEDKFQIVENDHTSSFSNRRLVIEEIEEDSGKGEVSGCKFKNNEHLLKDEPCFTASSSCLPEEIITCQSQVQTHQDIKHDASGPISVVSAMHPCNKDAMMLHKKKELGQHGLCKLEGICSENNFHTPKNEDTLSVSGRRLVIEEIEEDSEEDRKVLDCKAKEIEHIPEDESCYTTTSSRSQEVAISRILCQPRIQECEAVGLDGSGSISINSACTMAHSNVNMARNPVIRMEDKRENFEETPTQEDKQRLPQKRTCYRFQGTRGT